MDNPMPKLTTPAKHGAPAGDAAVELDYDAEWLWRVYRSRLQDALAGPAPPMTVAAAPARGRRRSRAS
jgi:hypothetical protein